MPRPIDFPGTNLHLTAPKGQEHRVRDIDAYNNGNGVTVLCLQFSADEIVKLIDDKGQLFLSIWSGNSIPPFYVGSKEDVRAVVVDYGPLWKEHGA